MFSSFGSMLFSMHISSALFLLFSCIFIMFFSLHLSLKLGIVTGRDLAQACRDHYSKPMVYFLWILCEIAIAACDLAEVIGSAIALNLLFGIPLVVGIVLTACDVMLILLLQNKGFRILECLVAGLIFIIGGCFAYELIISRPDLPAVVANLIPKSEIVFNPEMLYIFYDDGSLSIGASGADVVIKNGAGSGFGKSLVAADLNSDGRTDLAVGDTSNHAYIFYNDGSIPTTAATADIKISGADYFGGAMTTGDFNADGRTDLAVSAWYYSSYAGQVFIFYNDGVSLGTVICTTDCLASNADITITGEAGSHLGDYNRHTLDSGDFNADGRTDLAVAGTYSGRVYIFYNDGVSLGTTVCTTDCLAANADVIVTGVGGAIVVGDFNTDGKMDFANSLRRFT
jgi:hypothetical protein